jgi:hypothetical protein
MTMTVMSISMDEAKRLVDLNEPINLDITSGLTVDIAEILVQVRGGVSLHSLTILRDEVAYILGRYPDSVSVGGVRLKASVQAIQYLASHIGPELGVHNIHEFNIEMAEALRFHKGRLSLSVHRKETLTDDALIKLAAHQGKYLYISPDFELTEQVMKAFLAHEGELQISPSNMSSAIAKKFKKHHRGEVHLPGRFVTVTQYMPY